MTGHHCHTGWHTEPHYSCYSMHGCRCDDCTELKVARNRRDRRRAGGRKTVHVPAVAWDNISDQLDQIGITTDEWIRQVARKVTA